MTIVYARLLVVGIIAHAGADIEDARRLQGVVLFRFATE
jgi:hypothetical protein